MSQRNVAVLLDAIAKNSGDVTANRLRASLETFVAWVIRQGIRLPEGNVVSHTGKRKETPRDRVLGDDELKAVWKACDDTDHGAILKLLILTGQRADEIGSLRWDEVKDDRIELPSERTKNKRPHTVSLSDPARAILDHFRMAGRVHVFGRDDSAGFRGWGGSKRRLDERIARAGTPLAAWVVHDFRRTVATRMAELGVQPHVIEAVLNHIGGARAGVAGIYNRATYDKEKRAALNLWAAHVLAVVEGRAATVVPMKRA
jgi:integrase